MPISQLAQAIATFTHSPERGAMAMRRVMEVEPHEFLKQAASILEQFELSRGATYLLALLGASGNLFGLLSGLASTNRTALREVLKVVQAVYPTFEDELVIRFGECPDSLAVSRCFAILECLEDSGKKAEILMDLHHSTDAKVRSRAALLLGRLGPSLENTHPNLSDPDARVRANAIESLWAIEGPEALESLIHAAADPNGRAAANAWVGLYLRGYPRSVEGLREMAGEPDPQRQASAAWGMGRVGDERFLPVLKRLVSSPHANVRSNALRAMGRIRRSQPQVLTAV